jgi:hypothetical protein
VRTLYVSCLLLLTPIPLLSGVGQARADLVDFSYQWSISPSSVITGSNPTRSTGSEQSSGSVAFALAPDGTSMSSLGSGLSAIPAATLTTTSSAPEQGPDSFASPFSMTLHLTDAASGASGDLTFAGAINGTLTATTSQLTADFSSPLTQQLTLGDYRYSVTIGPASVHVPAPGASAPALLDALVEVNPRGAVPPPLVEAPEPASLLLAAAALPAMTLACGRRFRGRRRTPQTA